MVKVMPVAEEEEEAPTRERLAKEAEVGGHLLVTMQRWDKPEEVVEDKEPEAELLEAPVQEEMEARIANPAQTQTGLEASQGVMEEAEGEELRPTPKKSYSSKL